MSGCGKLAWRDAFFLILPISYGFEHRGVETEVFGALSMWAPLRLLWHIVEPQHCPQVGRSAREPQKAIRRGRWLSMRRYTLAKPDKVGLELPFALKPHVRFVECQDSKGSLRKLCCGLAENQGIRHEHRDRDMFGGHY